ncbi:MAG: hypothetical protein ACREM3_17190 [Candidatus Rokuibacteriota bacterium]
MSDERTLEGWTPAIGDGATLDEVVDAAFDYRGDVTVVTADGREIVGFVYTRDRDVAEPFLKMFEPSGVSLTLRYAEVRAIRFTGKDTAAGKSYEAWLRRKAEGAPPPAP